MKAHCFGNLKPLRGLTVLFAAACTLCGAEPPAATAPQPTGVLTLYYDNDTFDGADRWNTAAQKIAYAFRPEADWADTILPDWASVPARILPWMDEADTQKVVAIALGQQFFTPVSKTLVPPDRHDRPYAGWLYANLSWVAQSERARDVLQLSVGVVGPWALARETQNFAHDFFDVEKFDGWDYQLPNEPALMLAYERMWRLVREETGSEFAYDAMPLAGIVVGNVYDYVNAGFLARFGWRLPDDYNPQCIRPAGVQTPSLSPDVGDVSFYLFSPPSAARRRAIFSSTAAPTATASASRNTGLSPKFKAGRSCAIGASALSSRNCTEARNTSGNLARNGLHRRASPWRSNARGGESSPFFANARQEGANAPYGSKSRAETTCQSPSRFSHVNSHQPPRVHSAGTPRPSARTHSLERARAPSIVCERLANSTERTGAIRAHMPSAARMSSQVRERIFRFSKNTETPSFAT